MTGVRLRGVEGAEIDLGIAGDRFSVPPDDREACIDLRHLWAVPGLADSHAHLTAGTIGEMVAGVTDEQAMIRANVAAQLAGGVLLIADKGSRTDAVLGTLGWPADQRPELSAAGTVLAPAGGYYPEFEIDVAGPDLPAAVVRATGGGATWVKLIGDWPRQGVGALPNYAEDELRSAVTVAHDRGARVAIHAAAPDTPSMAVAAGIDSIEHGLFLTETDVQHLGARGGAWVPTVAAMEGLAEMLGAHSSGGRLFAQGLANVRSLLGCAIEAGVVLLAGTDLHLPHGGVAGEALALVRYGLDQGDALQTLTNNAYAYFGSERGFAPRMLADVVAFAINPLEDIAALAKPEVVIRAGRVVD